MTAPFNVGDRVRYISSGSVLSTGTVYTVRELVHPYDTSAPPIGVKLEGQEDLWWRFERFALVSRAPDAEFRVGDRVEVLRLDEENAWRAEYVNVGGIYTVTSVGVDCVTTGDPGRAEYMPWTAAARDCLRKLPSENQETPVTTAPFKSGDKIRALRGGADLTEGRIYEVSEFIAAGRNGRSSDSIRFVDDSGESYTRRADTFEKVEAPTYVPTAEHLADIRTIFEALEATKSRREWCGEYQTHLDRVNQSLTVKLAPAEPEWKAGDVFKSRDTFYTRDPEGGWWYYSRGERRKASISDGEISTSSLLTRIVKGGQLVVSA